MQDRLQARREMVERQLIGRGIRDQAVLTAMARVPREIFCSPESEHEAYADSALPIESGQTISQPYVVAAMAQSLRLDSNSRVLEIGLGSGYAAAVMAEIAKEVYAIERHENLANLAAERFESLDYKNIRVRHGDGTKGWPEASPFDAISVAAAAPEVPPLLVEQLAEGGRMVLPLGHRGRIQQLMLVRKDDRGEVRQQKLFDVRFVPLVGE